MESRLLLVHLCTESHPVHPGEATAWRIWVQVNKEHECNLHAPTCVVVVVVVARVGLTMLAPRLGHAGDCLGLGRAISQSFAFAGFPFF